MKFILKIINIKNINKSRYYINEALKKYKIMLNDINTTLKKINV